VKFSRPDPRGERAVHRITPDHVREYLAERNAAKASGRTIDIELSILRGILARANRLHLFVYSGVFAPLKERRDIGRALAHDEQLRLIAKA
jgi:site-specific recombinase XerC